MNKLLTTLLGAGLLATAGSTFAQPVETETQPANAPTEQAGNKEPRAPRGPGAEELRERLKNMTPEEREAMRAQRQERRAKMLERFDADKDGKLSAEERETMRETLKEEGVELPPRAPGGPRPPGGPKPKDEEASAD